MKRYKVTLESITGFEQYQMDARSSGSALRQVRHAVDTSERNRDIVAIDIDLYPEIDGSLPDFMNEFRFDY